MMNHEMKIKNIFYLLSSIINNYRWIPEIESTKLRLYFL